MNFYSQINFKIFYEKLLTVFFPLITFNFSTRSVPAFNPIVQSGVSMVAFVHGRVPPLPKIPTTTAIDFKQRVRIDGVSSFTSHQFL